VQRYADHYWRITSILAVLRPVSTPLGEKNPELRRKMNPLYITSLIRPDNEPEPALQGNELRINPAAGLIMEHYYELSDSGPTGAGDVNK